MSLISIYGAPTYSYRAADVSVAALATDVMTLSGAAGKVIRITKVGVSGSATAASLLDLYFGKRNTPDTGGTSTNPTPSIYYSIDPPAKGVITLYTANPTVGTISGGFEGDIIFLPAAGTPTGSPTHWERQYAVMGDVKFPTLRSANESFAFSFGGQTIPAGAKFYFYIEWTEDDV